MTEDTIFALSSGRPPSAIAVIRISGSKAIEASSGLCGSLPPVRQAGVRALHDPASGELLDEALVLRFEAPASATGEDQVELHCHGGRAVVDAVLAALSGLPGLREAKPGEFTRRAFENGRIDLLEAEGLADLLEAETQSQRRAAMLLADGVVSGQIGALQQDLLALSARAEAAIDYVGDDEVEDYHHLYRDCEALATELGKWLDQPRAEPLKDGLLVVIAGPPNSGKSSLLNALVSEERAIVTDIPGTTRDHVEASIALAGVPLRLTDTAGIRDSNDPVERIGVARAVGLVGRADLLLWTGDPEDQPEHPHRLLLHTRSDAADRGPCPSGSLAVSVKTGEGLGDLQAWLVGESSALLPAEGKVALNRRQGACLAEARDCLAQASQASDIVLLAELLRTARLAFDRLTGRAGVDDLLDMLFGRFCLGK